MDYQCDVPIQLDYANGGTLAVPIPQASFYFNNQTGQVTFNGTVAGDYAVAFKVEEYNQAGILVGSSMRELSFELMDCPPPISYSQSFDTATLAIQSFQRNSYYELGVELVAGRPSSFCYNIQSSDTLSSIHLANDFLLKMPGSTISYVGQNTDKVKLCFNWTPTINDLGYYYCLLEMTDTNCKFNSLGTSGGIGFPIWVRAEYPTRIANFSNATIKVYPNPTKGILQIATDQPVLAKLFSLDGRLLISRKVMASINLANLTTGMYIMQLLSPEDGKLLSVQKIQVMK